MARPRSYETSTTRPSSYTLRHILIPLHSHHRLIAHSRTHCTFALFQSVHLIHPHRLLSCHRVPFQSHAQLVYLARTIWTRRIYLPPHPVPTSSVYSSSSPLICVPDNMSTLILPSLALDRSPFRSCIFYGISFSPSCPISVLHWRRVHRHCLGALRVIPGYDDLVLALKSSLPSFAIVVPLFLIISSFVHRFRLLVLSHP
ncbi:hypothetical protein OF83DRAFT_1097934 [Amylostereum chailletii]|nr:hypothetical protein OF83DRAFT_1097934 [Amylostereum chailletii]